MPSNPPTRKPPTPVSYTGRAVEKWKAYTAVTPCPFALRTISGVILFIYLPAELQSAIRARCRLGFPVRSGSSWFDRVKPVRGQFRIREQARNGAAVNVDGE